VVKLQVYVIKIKLWLSLGLVAPALVMIDHDLARGKGVIAGKPVI
jgi:hypothetical protein